MIPLNGGSPKPTYIPTLASQPRKVNGHLPTIKEQEQKPAINGHLPTAQTILPTMPEPTKQPAQFVTPAIELRTSA